MVRWWRIISKHSPGVDMQMNTHLKTVKMTVSPAPSFMLSSELFYRLVTVILCLSTLFQFGATTSASSYYLTLFPLTLYLSMTHLSRKHARRSLLPAVGLVVGLIVVVHGEVEGVVVVADVAAASEECRTQNDGMGTPRHVLCVHSIDAYLVLRGIKNLRSSIPMRCNVLLNLL